MSSADTKLELEGKSIFAAPPGELKADFRKLTPFMSADETRYYLCGIFCKLQNDTLTMCATNGHILCEIESMGVTVEEYGDFEIIIPSTAVHHLVKVMPKTSDCPYITVKVSPDLSHVEFESADFSYTTRTVDGKFPDYKPLIPEGKNEIRSGLRAGYLMAALKALGDTPINMAIDSEEIDAGAPQLITASESDGIKCVIMPTRV